MSPPSFGALSGFGVQPHGQQDGQKAHKGGDQRGRQHELDIAGLLRVNQLLGFLYVLKKNDLKSVICIITIRSM